MIHLDHDVGGEAGSLAGVAGAELLQEIQAGSLAGVAGAELLQEIQAGIHDNIGVLCGFLAGDREARPLANLGRSLRDRVAARDEVLVGTADPLEAVRNRAAYHLARIHATILEIATGVGAPVEAV